MWPLDKNDDAYDVDIEPSRGGEDEAGISTAPGASSSSSPMTTMPPLALLQDYYWAMYEQPDLKFPLSLVRLSRDRAAIAAK